MEASTLAELQSWIEEAKTQKVPEDFIWNTIKDYSIVKGAVGQIGNVATVKTLNLDPFKATGQKQPIYPENKKQYAVPPQEELNKGKVAFYENLKKEGALAGENAPPVERALLGGLITGVSGHKAFPEDQDKYKAASFLGSVAGFTALWEVAGFGRLGIPGAGKLLSIPKVGQIISVLHKTGGQFASLEALQKIGNYIYDKTQGEKPEKVKQIFEEIGATYGLGAGMGYAGLKIAELAKFIKSAPMRKLGVEIKNANTQEELDVALNKAKTLIKNNVPEAETATKEGIPTITENIDELRKIQPAKTFEPLIEPVKPPKEITVYRAGNLEPKVSTPPDIEGIYFSDNIETAKLYGEMGDKSKAKPYKIILKNPATIETEHQVAKELGVKFTEDGMPAYNENEAWNVALELKQRGYDSIDRNGEYVVFDKSQVKPLSKELPVEEHPKLKEWEEHINNTVDNLNFEKDEIYALRGDDFIPKQKFRKSWNRPDGKKTERMEGTSGVELSSNSAGGDNTIDIKYLKKQIEKTKSYGDNIFLIKGERIGYGNDDFNDEIILGTHKIIGKISKQDLTNFYNKVTFTPPKTPTVDKGVQEKVLNKFDLGKWYSPKAIQSKLDIEPNTFENVIKQLKDKDLLEYNNGLYKRKEATFAGVKSVPTSKTAKPLEDVKKEGLFKPEENKNQLTITKDKFAKYKSNIDEMRKEVEAGEAGFRAYNTEGKAYTGSPSTFPDWFKNTGYDKKQVLNIIDKYKAGKTLTEIQSKDLEKLISNYRTYQLDQIKMGREFINKDREELIKGYGRDALNLNDDYAALDAGIKKTEDIQGAEISKERQRGSISWKKKEIPFNVEQQSSITMGRNIAKWATQVIKSFQFYPNVAKKYPAFQEDIRTGIFGQWEKALGRVDKIEKQVFGGLSQQQRTKVMEVLHLEDDLQNVSRGIPTYYNKKLTTEAEIKERLERAYNIADETVKDRIRVFWTRQGELNKIWEDRGYIVQGRRVPKIPVKYWDKMGIGIPQSIKKPYRRYFKKRVGYSGEYSQDPATIRYDLLNGMRDNLVEDFGIAELNKYDIYKYLPKETKANIETLPVFKSDLQNVTISNASQRFPIDETTINEINKMRAINNEPLLKAGNYFAYKFNRVGRGKFYLVPEEIHEALTHFRQTSYNPAMNIVTAFTRGWKFPALLTSEPGFSIQNFFGDLQLAGMHNTKTLFKVDKAFNLMRTKPENYSEYQKGFTQWMNNGDVLSGFNKREVARFLHTPIKAITTPITKFWELRETFPTRLSVAFDLYDDLLHNVDLVKKYPEFHLEGLTKEQQSQKVAREMIIDYGGMSETYNKFIRNGLRPFALFYDKLSYQNARLLKTHPVKTISKLTTIPIIASLFNNSNKERKEIENKLPEQIQQQAGHFVIKKLPGERALIFMPNLIVNNTVGGSTVGVLLENLNDVGSKDKAGHIVTVLDAVKKSLLTDIPLEEINKQIYTLNPFIKASTNLIRGKDSRGQRLFPTGISLSDIPFAKQAAIYGKELIKETTPMYMRYMYLNLKPENKLQQITSRALGFYVLDLKDSEKQWNDIQAQLSFNEAKVKAKDLYVSKGREAFNDKMFEGQKGGALKEYIYTSKAIQKKRLKELYRTKQLSAEQYKQELNKIDNPEIKEKLQTIKTTPYYEEE